MSPNVKLIEKSVPGNRGGSGIKETVITPRLLLLHLGFICPN